MVGLRVTVPFASWRKGWSRQLLETEEVPPPSTCYGFLLSLVGEMDSGRYAGARVGCSMLTEPPVSTVFRTLWKAKDRKTLPGQEVNLCPDYQQVLSQVDVVVWVEHPDLEERVRLALEDPSSVERSCPLCLGESRDIVDSVDLYQEPLPQEARTLVLSDEGQHTFTTRVHFGRVYRANYATCDLVQGLSAPVSDQLPEIPGIG